ncbi:MAG: T9SS type A sorting domain-containing protein, partial [Candidatus Kapabacteria bacterium]|nr:T9SS type A sorting domain-containing protein [Candidatus Kapabacteria bacterium]
LSAYPNPFAGELRITLNLKKAARVNISIVDISGNKVEIITNNALNIGNNELIWKPEHLSQGKYFLNAEIDGTVLSRELIYLK